MQQDPLENFNGQIRFNGGNCTKQTSTYCENSIKSVVLKGMINLHTAGFNCEEDNSTTLCNFTDAIGEYSSYPVIDKEFFLAECNFRSKN